MLKGYTKAEKSWMLYDWANSAFATIIAAIILPIFFKEIAHQNGVSDVDATAFWGYATSCGTLICAVLARRHQQRTACIYGKLEGASGAVCPRHARL